MKLPKERRKRGPRYRPEYPELYIDEDSIRYKGFVIFPDRMLGYSLIGTNGKWCCSCLGVKECIASAESILKAEA